jgi:squalene-associated FAD-dependent desaturase
MKGISIGDKLRTFKVGGAIRGNGRYSPGSVTVDQWLDELGQSARIKQRFWYPMVVATLNQSPELASAQMLKVVLQQAFGGDPTSAQIGISRVGLSDLYTDGAFDFIKSRGGAVQTNAQVRRLIVVGGVVIAVEMKDGQRIEGDYFISAVPPGALFEILPDELRNREFERLGSLGSSPIVSINLWFDRQIIDREFVGLLGTRCQWLFNKDLILNSRPAGMPALQGSPDRHSNQVAVIISAARDFVDLTKNELVEMSVGELHELLPSSRQATLIHSVIVKEREATLSHTVESDSLRLGPRTSVPNLILAGDWTDTGLPATIESAVMSGDVAAEIVES